MTPRIERISPESAFLPEVKSLWRQHSDTLGFFPDEAFNDYAHARTILVATLDDRFAGYLLYRVTRERVSIVHLCVAAEYRKQGVVRGLFNELRSNTKGLRGIFLKCRREFEANATWPRLNFALVGESPGKSAKGSTLNHWWYDYGEPDLFDQQPKSESLDVVIDYNVFVDLVDERVEESLGLLADWLQDSVTLCCTQELLNEPGRSEDGEIRKRRRIEAERFHMLRCKPEDIDHAESVVRPLFPSLESPQDESDYRHIVRALATGADAFVTRDGPLLEKSEAIFNACGLAVVRPSELISRVDTLMEEKSYQRQFVAGTREVSQTRVSEVAKPLVQRLCRGNESKRELTAQFNRYLADPKRFECHSLENLSGESLGFYVLERSEACLKVPLLRVCGKRRSGTLARYLLTGIVRRAVIDGFSSVFLPDSELTEVLQSACADSGFVPVEGGRVKFVLQGILNSSEAAQQLDWPGTHVDQLREAISSVAEDASTASRVEHALWPAKVVDAELPCFIVPIDPRYAEQLFDERLASSGLFGADVDLALNPLSAYYRAAIPRVLTCPSRILWYVKSVQAYSGTKAIRACSRMVELQIGRPKSLFQRFRRLGVYEWEEVRATAKGDLEKEIMAFSFDDTELCRPIYWDEFQSVLRSHGVGAPLQSPARIPPPAFAEIYALAFNSSKIR